MFLAWQGRLGVVVAAAAVGAIGCDQSVRGTEKVPPGEVERVSLAVPVDGLTIGPIGMCDSNDDCADDDPCTEELCKNGACLLGDAPDGTPCDDGNSCTTGDRCAGGACRGGSGGVICPIGDACTRYTCDPRGACIPVYNTGASCSNQDLCTFGDICNDAGKCIGKPLSCQDDACNDRACNGTDTCEVRPRVGAACSDGQACTHGETCDERGLCSGGNALTCTSDACNLRTCNGTDTCKVIPRTGAVCDDANLCTYADECSDEGRCAGTAIVCTSDDTAERTCNGSSTCTITPRPGAACDDGNPCTKGDVRSSQGVCAGMPYSCPPSDCLVSSVCDGKGGCDSVAKDDGTACDADGSRCTPRDICRGGVCLPDSRPVTCIERDCNSVVCNHATGNCDYTPTSGGACGVSGCHEQGTCQNGTCSGRAKDCSELDGPCLTGACDAATGECVGAPKLNGTSCSAGGQCTGAAACAFGVCELAPTTCPPSSAACKVAACDPGSGQCLENNRPAGAICDPKNSCMTDATCDDQGTCIGTPAANGQPCTDALGRIGACVASQCVVEIKPDAGPPAAPDAQADAPPAADAGAPADTRVDTAVTVPRGKPKGGCHLAPSFVDGDGEIGGVGGGPTPWLALSLLLGLVLRRRR